MSAIVKGALGALVGGFCGYVFACLIAFVLTPIDVPPGINTRLVIMTMCGTFAGAIAACRPTIGANYRDEWDQMECAARSDKDSQHAAKTGDMLVTPNDSTTAQDNEEQIASNPIKESPRNETIPQKPGAAQDDSLEGRKKKS